MLCPDAESMLGMSLIPERLSALATVLDEKEKKKLYQQLRSVTSHEFSVPASGSVGRTFVYTARWQQAHSEYVSSLTTRTVRTKCNRLEMRSQPTINKIRLRPALSVLADGDLKTVTFLKCPKTTTLLRRLSTATILEWQ